MLNRLNQPVYNHYVRSAENSMKNLKRKLKSLSKKEWELLKETGMLWEIYPESPSTYEEIRKK